MSVDVGLSPNEYANLVSELKQSILTARVRAALSVNRELVLLYWGIGQRILQGQQQQGWGAKIIERLSTDLRQAFPDMKGLSSRNLKYMRAFAEAWPEEAIVQQLVAQLPWGHNVRLLDYVKSNSEREWYARETLRNGWSRSVLVHQIETGLWQRSGKALSNFATTLPEPQADLARELFKDPYSFDFLAPGDDLRERDLERALIDRIRDFLLELGVGFAFVGSQHRLEIDGREFFIDLLFYHLSLRCFVVVELKAGDFQPEYAGKLNFYLAAVDDLLRHPDDKPTVGICLCKTRSRVIVEYSLRDMLKPLGVSTYQLSGTLPADLQGRLPSVEDLQAELSRAEYDDDPGSPT